MWYIFKVDRLHKILTVNKSFDFLNCDLSPPPKLWKFLESKNWCIKQINNKLTITFEIKSWVSFNKDLRLNDLGMTRSNTMIDTI
jgi:hypothetical protein